MGAHYLCGLNKNEPPQEENEPLVSETVPESVLVETPPERCKEFDQVATTRCQLHHLPHEIHKEIAKLLPNRDICRLRESSVALAKLYNLPQLYAVLNLNESSTDFFLTNHLLELRLEHDSSSTASKKLESTLREATRKSPNVRELSL